jgi:hypothetical protein
VIGIENRDRPGLRLWTDQFSSLHQIQWWCSATHTLTRDFTGPHGDSHAQPHPSNAPK